MKHLSSVGLVLLGLTVLAAPAYAGLGVLGTLTFSGADGRDRNALNTTNPFTSKGRLGFGAFLRGDANYTANLEAGVNYTPRTYGVGTANGTITLPTLEVPLMLRITALPILSFGIGGYYAYKIGDATAEGAIPLVYSPLNFNSHDFGLVGAVGVQFPLGLLALLGEFRYMFGLSDLDPDPIGELKTRHFQFLAGVLFKI